MIIKKSACTNFPATIHKMKYLIKSVPRRTFKIKKTVHINNTSKKDSTLYIFKMVWPLNIFNVEYLEILEKWYIRNKIFSYFNCSVIERTTELLTKQKNYKFISWKLSKTLKFNLKTKHFEF